MIEDAKLVSCDYVCGHRLDFMSPGPFDPAGMLSQHGTMNWHNLINDCPSCTQSKISLAEKWPR